MGSKSTSQVTEQVHTFRAAVKILENTPATAVQVRKKEACSLESGQWSASMWFKQAPSGTGLWRASIRPNQVPGDTGQPRATILHTTCLNHESCKAFNLLPKRLVATQ